MIVLMSEGSRIKADALLDYYTGLGGPGGEALTLEVLTREQLQTPMVLSLIEEAGLLCLVGENPIPLVQNLYNNRALHQIIQGYTTLQGLTVLGVGAGAAALAKWVFGPSPQYLQAMGLGWLHNAVVVPHFTRTEDSPVLRQLPKVAPDVLGLGIPNGCALALGPLGQVETWGSGEVTAVIKA
jgi:cyanophycinase-like exopeptidase